MKKITIIQLVTLTLATALYSESIIKKLEDSKAKLVKGKEDITQGKQSVKDGYWEMKTKVINTLNNGAHKVQLQIDGVESNKSAAKDLLDKKLPMLMGLLTPLLITPLSPIAATIILAIPVFELILHDTPKVLKSVISTLTSIKNTLSNAVAIINPANEKLNPNSLLYFIQNMPASIKTITQDASNSAGKIQSTFITTINNTANALLPILLEIKSKINTVTERLNDLTILPTITAKIKPLIEAMENARKNAAGAEQETYSKAIIVPDEKDNAFKPDPKAPDQIAARHDLWNAEVAARKDRAWSLAGKILSVLNALTQQLEREKGTPHIPPVYEKFNAAEEKFQKAIDKIDEIISHMQKV